MESGSYDVNNDLHEYLKENLDHLLPEISIHDQILLNELTVKTEFDKHEPKALKRIEEYHDS